MQFLPLTRSNRLKMKIKFHNGSAHRFGTLICRIILHNLICKFIYYQISFKKFLLFTVHAVFYRLILRDASFTFDKKNNVNKNLNEIYISGVQLESSTEAHTDVSDISRSTCEGCNEYRRRRIKLSGRFRKAKGAQQKLKNTVVELEKANEFLTEANSMF